MKDKRILLALFLVLSINAATYAQEVEGRADEVEIDLNTNTMTSESGIVLKQSNMKTKVHTVQRDTDAGKAYYRDGIIAQVDNETGKVKIESQEGEANTTGDEAHFYKNFGYLEVAPVTGAEVPNDRVYFGSDHISYKDEKIYIDKGWMTTDFKVINHSQNPKEISYHILSDQIVIEPDKHLTIYDSNLYLGKHKTLPMEFPWFRLNIRGGSKVPLFPNWSEKEYYGWQTSWGVLYGNRSSKLKGGIAPKFADDMGWLIGRSETWYDTERYGTAQLNVTDLLLHSKVKGKKDSVDAVKYEQKHKRYHVETKHDYDGEYGSFHFSGINATTSMISSLDELITKYEANKEFDNTAGLRGSGVYLDRPGFDKNVAYYSVNSDLHGMGKNKDIRFQASSRLTTDKKLYTLSTYDNVEDNVFDTKGDNALYTNVSLYQDNTRYKLGGYYNYLYDITPGYTRKYDRSRGEDYGFVALDKKNTLGIQYDEIRGDKLRGLHLWETESNATALKRSNLLGLPIDYTPVAVSEYSIYNQQNGKLLLGDYSSGKLHIKPSIATKREEKQLDLLENEKIVITDNSSANPENYIAKGGYDRFRQYNRFNNEVYEKRKENKANINIIEDDSLNVNVFGGNQKEEIWTREGMISGKIDDVTKLKSESSFYGFDIEKKFGTLALRGDLRQDDYRHSDGSSLRYGLGLNHKVNLYEKEDVKVSNDLDIYMQKYRYSGGKEEDKAQNLYTKKDSYQIKDTLSWDTKAVHTQYSGEYQVDKNPIYHSDKKAEKLKQKINFQVGEDKKIGLFYDRNDRYTNRIVNKFENYKDLSTENYGGDFDYGPHSFAYERQNIDFQFPKIAKEEIEADSFRYSYRWDDKSLGFSYRTGKDSVLMNEFHDSKVLDIDNKVYGVNFHKNGDIQHHVYFNYENSRHREGSSKVNLEGSRKNIGHTDEINFSYQYRDTRMKDAEYIKYASLETGKAENELSVQDIERVKSLWEDKKVTEDPFHLTGIRDDAFLFGDGRVNFRFYTSLERNKARYEKTHNLGDSLQKIKGAMYYTYNRYGLGYTFEENAGWLKNNSQYTWKKKNREHQISLYGKMGKPSESWKVKTYAKFYENLLDKVNADKKHKRALDGIGVEIGKEFDFYEWSVLYERKYSLTTRDYEWRLGLQFTLLTFPDNAIFSLGANKSSQKVRPKTQFMDSVNVEKIVDDKVKTKVIMQK